ncbi:MAG: tetratricopeptide repeat protein [Lacunisphaera sp.]|nr:tetratricopeptide repeat protein [Lacunisphaera sp.]
MTTPPAQSSPRLRDTCLAVLGIVGGATLAYHNTFSVPFLFDDNSSIRDNPTIHSLMTAWAPPAAGGLTVSGRPFLNFTLALNHRLSGSAVWSYHLLNLLIHVAAGCTLFGVVRRTLRRLPGVGAPLDGARGRPQGTPLQSGGVNLTSPVNRLLQKDSFWLALAVALLWTLHPLQTEAVTYIIQRAESLVGLMYLLTLWCFIRATEPGAAKIWGPLAFVTCLLGMATKEVMVTAPVMIVLYDRVFLTNTWREVWQKRGRLHLALAATWLLLGWLVLSTGNRGGTAGLGGEVSPWAYALTQIGAVVHYLRLAVWPQPLVFDYGKALAGGWGDVWWQALILFPLVAASLWAAWRGRAAGWCGLFFFAVLAPSSSFVPVVTQTMNEHRVYLALAAIVTLAVTGLYVAWGRRSFAVFAVLAIALTAATVRRNHDYRTELALWEDTVLKRPGNARAFGALGAIHQREGRLDQALAALQEAVRVAPRSAESHNNLGNVWMKLGRWEDARRGFAQALVLKPDDPFALNNLGNALLQLGRGSEAITRFEAALRAKPDFAEPRYNLANTLAQAGRPAEAATHYEAFLHAHPHDAEARSNYGSVLQELGRAEDAITQFETAVLLRPNDARLHNNLGVALAQAGRPAEALEEFHEAVRLDPNFQEAQMNAARAARALGNR